MTVAGSGPLAAPSEDGYLDASGFAEEVTAGGGLSGLVGDRGFQLIPTDLRGTALAEANLTPRIASPFGERDVHPARSAAIDYVQKG